MQRLVLLILGSLLLGSPVWAGSATLNLNLSGTAGGTSCSVQADYFTGDTVYAFSFGNGDTTYYVGQGGYTAASSVCVCKVSFEMYLGAGTITGKSFYATIWAAGIYDGLPANPISNGTSAAVSGSQDWNATQVDFTFSPCASITESTDYAITVHMDGASDASNYARIGYMITTAMDGASEWWNISKALTNGDDPNSARIKIWW